MQVPEEFRCCVCLAAAERTLRTPCPHRICVDCTEAGAMAACPICRQDFPRGRPVDEAFGKRVAEARVPCGCGESVSVLRVEDHACEHTKKRRTMSDEAQAALSRAPAPAPNRSTFRCPLCGERNLSQSGLLEHCEREHAGRGAVAAVCPVCLAMPWGDPNYVSRDFLSHLRMRHRCNYEEICDFEADEETMLRRAMEESMQTAGVDEAEQDMLLQAILAESAREAEEDSRGSSASDDVETPSDQAEESNAAAEDASAADAEAAGDTDGVAGSPEGHDDRGLGGAAAACGDHAAEPCFGGNKIAEHGFGGVAELGCGNNSIAEHGFGGSAAEQGSPVAAA